MLFGNTVLPNSESSSLAAPISFNPNNPEAMPAGRQVS